MIVLSLEGIKTLKKKEVSMPVMSGDRDRSIERVRAYTLNGYSLQHGEETMTVRTGMHKKHVSPDSILNYRSSETTTAEGGRGNTSKKPGTTSLDAFPSTGQKHGGLCSAIAQRKAPTSSTTGTGRRSLTEVHAVLMIALQKAQQQLPQVA